MPQTNNKTKVAIYARVSTKDKQDVQNQLGELRTWTRKMGYPFNPVTRIEFEVPNSVFVVLEIYDVLGDLIKTVVRGRFEPGQFFCNMECCK